MGKPFPMPVDFLEVAESHTLKELQEMYHCSIPVIRRWLKHGNIKQKNARGRGFDDIDTIHLCLTCPFGECLKDCGRVKPIS